jgi:hypothetical protein
MLAKAAVRERLLLAGSVSALPRQETACRHDDPTGRVDVWARHVRHGVGPLGGAPLPNGRTARTGDQISVCSEISRASSTSMPR